MNVLKVLPKSWVFKIGSQITASLLKIILAAVGALLIEKGWTDPGSWQSVTGSILAAVAALWAGAGSATQAKIPLSVAKDPATRQIINAASLDIRGKESLPPF